MQQTRRRRGAPSVSFDTTSDGCSSDQNASLHSSGKNSNSKHTRNCTESAISLIVLILIISCVIFLSERTRTKKDVLTTENDNNQEGDTDGSMKDEIAPTNQVVRIGKETHANYTEYIPCINDVGDMGAINPFLPIQRKRTRQPSYTALKCTPEPSKCFRAVFDGYDHLRGAQDDAYAKVIQSLIIPKDGEPTVPPLHKSVSRHKTYQVDISKNAANYGEMHVDYFESPQYVYTSILYDEPSADLVGGETMLANVESGFRYVESEGDSGNMQKMELVSGVIVEPKKGRLVLFTSGGENVHAPMEVLKGQRPTHHVWFTC